MDTNYKNLVEKLADLPVLPDEEQKQTLIEVLGLTHSYISIDKLNSILPQEQYSKVLSSLETVGIDNKEQLQDKKCFLSIADNKIQLKLEDFGEIRDFVLCDIQLDEINLDNLFPVVKDVAQTHIKNIEANENLEQSSETRSILMHTQKAIGRIGKIKEAGVSYLELNEKLDNFSELSDDEKMSTAIQAMGMTQSHLNFNDLKNLLPQEQYEKIELDVRNRIATRFEHIDAPDEAKKAAIDECLADEVTFISVDQNGVHLQRYEPYTQYKEPQLADIDQKDLNIETFLPVVEETMKIHEGYGKTGTIWENSILSSEQIKTILAKTQHAIVKDNVKDQHSFIKRQVEKIKELAEKVKKHFNKEKSNNIER